MKIETNAYAAAEGALTPHPRFSIGITFLPRDSSVKSNLLLQSEDITTTWTDSGSPTITANDESAPDGAITADKIEDTGTGSQFIFQSGISISGGVKHVASTFIKKDSVTKNTRHAELRVEFGPSSTISERIKIDTLTGEFNIPDSTTGDLNVKGGVIDFDENWWRVWISATPATGHTTATVYFYPARGNGAGWANNSSAAGFVHVWGFQLSEANTLLYYEPTTTTSITSGDEDNSIVHLTSHSDVILSSGLPSRIDGCIKSIGGQSQKITPDAALHSIGKVTFEIGNVSNKVSSLFNLHLENDQGLRRKRIELYKGHDSLTDRSDYSLRLTYIIDEVQYKDGVFKLHCSDIQRTVKTNIFEKDQGRLTSSITAASTTIPITVANASDKFQLLDHDAVYGSNPSDEVGYIQIDDEIICHDGWNGGFTALNVVERGALNTVAVAHNVTATEESQKKVVDEYIYLEMPAPKLVYALLTGDLEGQPGKTLPTRWHLRIPTSYVELSDFTGIGDDLWDSSANTGRLARFFEPDEQQGKKFIQEQILLWLRCFMPVYSTGKLGLKRLGSALPDAAFDDLIGESQIMSYGDLKHDYSALINAITINWNWIPRLDRFSKVTHLIDATSLAAHGRNEIKEFDFEGVFVGVHSDSDIQNYLLEIRNRYSNPPLLLSVDVGPEWDRLEVGDSVKITSSQIIDYNSGSSIDRTFEIQQVRTDWVSGNVRLQLFGGIEAVSHSSLSASNVMSDSFYTSSGTELSTVLTISGGAVTANGTLTGGATKTVFYYDGDLTINSGVTITCDRNVEIRVKGFLTINGTLDCNGNSGDTGAVGISHSGRACRMYVRLVGQDQDEGASPILPGILPKTVKGKYTEMPVFNVLNADGTESGLTGVPDNLQGVDGAIGGAAVLSSSEFSDRTAAGGAGGVGGGGLIVVCRGAAFGTSGSINLDGTAGSTGSTVQSDDSPFLTIQGQSGGGGFPGGILFLIDGDYSLPFFSSSTISALRGDHPDPGADEYLFESPGYVQFGETGYGQRIVDTTNYWSSVARAQFIPPAENGYTWLPIDEEIEIPGSPARANRVFTGTTAGSSGNLTSSGAGSPDSDTLASLTISNTRQDSTITVDVTGLFDDTGRGGVASLKSYDISVEIAGESFALFSSGHSFIPLPTTQFSIASTRHKEGAGDGGSIDIDVVAQVSSLEIGNSATWTFDYSNISITATESMP